MIDELARRGTPFVGCLFAGLMLDGDGPKVLEFNARFGDPETQVLMPRLEGDLLELLAAAAHGDLAGSSAPLTRRRGGDGRPRRPGLSGAQRLRRCARSTGSTRSGGALVFHGGTAVRDGALVTNGGRILSVTATGPTVSAARAHAYAAVEMIAFEGAQHRSDIAAGVDG